MDGRVWLAQTVMRETSRKAVRCREGLCLWLAAAAMRETVRKTVRDLEWRLVWPALAALMTTACIPEAGTGAVRGWVVDWRGQPIPGTVVTVTPKSMLERQECVTVTRETGQYVCADLEGQPFRVGRWYSIKMEKGGSPYRTETFDFQYSNDLQPRKTTLQELYAPEGEPLEPTRAAPVPGPGELPKS